jgi:ADP-heptose:LPS heptosyltransferase
MHLAVAVDRPVVGVFGPTNPVHVGPYRRPGSVVRLDLPCSPCNLRKLSECRYGHACMRKLRPEAVLAKMEAVLGQ